MQLYGAVQGDADGEKRCGSASGCSLLVTPSATRRARGGARAVQQGRDARAGLQGIACQCRRRRRPEGIAGAAFVQTFESRRFNGGGPDNPKVLYTEVSSKMNELSTSVSRINLESRQECAVPTGVYRIDRSDDAESETSKR